MVTFSTPDGKQVMSRKQNPGPPSTSSPDEFCHLQNNKKIYSLHVLSRNNYLQVLIYLSIYLLYKMWRDMKETLSSSVAGSVY